MSSDFHHQVVDFCRIRGIQGFLIKLEKIVGDGKAQAVERTGRKAMRAWDRTNAIRDKTIVMNRIFELKAEGLNLSEIGRQLTRENMMPVRFDSEKIKEQPDVAVVLVIDRSGSMQGPKLEAAKESARVTTEVLSPDSEFFRYLKQGPGK